MTNPTIPHGTEEQGMIEEPERCPFCAHMADVIEDKTAGPFRYRVMCRTGHTNGLSAGSRYAAISAWNQRAKPVVKTLEFVQNKIGSFDAVGWCYWIAQNDGDEAAFWAWGYAGDVLGEASHLPAAIAAVQGEHTRRVHACLEGYDHVED